MRKALEEKVALLHEIALAFWKKQEKLAAEFKTAKEAQDLGGAILVAQWRAAVADTKTPFVFSEEAERARQKQKP